MFHIVNPIDVSIDDKMLYVIHHQKIHELPDKIQIQLTGFWGRGNQKKRRESKLKYRELIKVRNYKPLNSSSVVYRLRVRHEV